jgi:hypothetical protein
MLALALVLGSGCLPTAGSRQPDWVRKDQDPTLRNFFPGCDTATGDNLHSRGFAAIVLALQSSNWTVERMDFVNKYVSARTCLANNPDHCVSLGFQANLRGGIRIVPLHTVERNLEDDLKRWMTTLEQSFAIYRCQTDEALGEEMQKYGFPL